MPQHGFRFEYIAVPEWPLLAWIARCQRSRDVVTVFHGSGVETTPEWFCEAVWAGDYERGEFDTTDVVAGTGGRIRPGEVIFVSSASTVDRLQSLATSDGAWISNSLACLLELAGARIDESSGDYYRLFRTIVRGVRKYRRQFPTSAGAVTLTYFDNLVWNGRQLAPRSKAGLGRDFSTFDRYAGFLQTSMNTLAANAAAAERKRRYQILSTASSGYDSSTVTVLAKNAGATQVLCFDQARRGQDDSGEPLARILGLEPVTVERSAWIASSALPEVPFLASDSHGGDVFYRGAESVLAGKVLLTGYHGDKVWAKEGHAVNDEIVRGDQSGLSLTDYRLSIGTIHCPVAFWGVRQIADIHAISNSPEMQRWDVPGDYSRPICRRIVESAGVPRESFGMEKKATWVLLHRNNNFLTPSSLSDYFDWLVDRRWTWIKHGRVPPSIDRRIDNFEVSLRRFAVELGQATPATWYKRGLRRTGLMRVVWRVGETPTRLRRHVFPWALEHQRRAYARPV